MKKIVTKKKQNNYIDFVSRTNKQMIIATKGKPGKDAVQLPIPAIVVSKQDKLVSGVNIKTINDESILGEGNIDIINLAIALAISL